MEDILTCYVRGIGFACIDNLTGFAEAIESVFPQTDHCGAIVQLCLVDQIPARAPAIAQFAQVCDQR